MSKVDLHLQDGDRELIVKGDLTLLGKAGLTLGLNPDNFFVSGNNTLQDVMQWANSWVTDLDGYVQTHGFPSKLRGVLRGRAARVVEAANIWLGYHNQGDGYWTANRLRNAVLGAVPYNSAGSPALVTFRYALPLLASGDLNMKGFGDVYREQLKQVLDNG